MQAEHTKQLHELTQRIGDLCQQVNDRDRTIEGLKEQRMTLLDSNERLAQLLNQLLLAARGYVKAKRKGGSSTASAWMTLGITVDVMAHIETNPKGTT